MLTVRLDPLQTHAWRLLQPGVIATYAWGRGAGKTYFGATAIDTWCLGDSTAHVGLLLPTLKQARAVYWTPVLLPQFYGALKPYIKRLDRTELVVEFVNGARLSTWGAENADAIRGQRFTHLVQDEADDIDPAVETSVVEPTFSKSGTLAIWLKTGTPKRGRYGTLFTGWRQGQEGTPERQALVDAGIDPRNFISLRFRSDQSPQVDAVWLDRTRRKLIATGRKTTYHREYECDFDAAEGLVYDLEPALHIAAPPKDAKWSEILVGLDHGYEDPAVFLVIGVLGHGRDADLWVLEEIYETHLLPHHLLARARGIRQRYAAWPQYWFADPSRPDTIGMYRNAGIPVREANNAIDDGVSAVADKLGVHEIIGSNGLPTGERITHLRISPRCPHTIAEGGKYRRKRDRKDNDRILDEIEDANNHAMDALRYAVFTRFGRPAAPAGLYTGIPKVL